MRFYRDDDDVTVDSKRVKKTEERRKFEKSWENKKKRVYEREEMNVFAPFGSGKCRSFCLAFLYSISNYCSQSPRVELDIRNVIVMSTYIFLYESQMEQYTPFITEPDIWNSCKNIWCYIHVTVMLRIMCIQFKLYRFTDVVLSQSTLMNSLCSE